MDQHHCLAFPVSCPKHLTVIIIIIINENNQWSRAEYKTNKVSD
jgi:hypothetical protein